MIRFLSLALFLVVGVARLGSAAERPNILFVYTDDQSYKSVGCYEGSFDWVRTPNIDALAKSGVRFTHAYMGTWCMPSRATMLTGHLQFGVESMRMDGEYPSSTYDPEKCPFWPRVFRKHGYVTAQIGKWHTGRDNGFGRDWDYQKVWNRPAFPKNAGNYFHDQLIQTNGTKAEKTDGYSTDNYTDWSVEFIEGKHRDPDKPWFLWVCYDAVHGPFLPAERHESAYPGVKTPIPEDIYPPRQGKPTYAREWREWVPNEDGVPELKGKEQKTVTTKMLHGNTLHDWVRQYNQGVAGIDEGVGRLVKALEETGQRENTLIVYTADQGFAWGEHGFRRKLAPYDANIRSPLIVDFPGRTVKGAVCRTPVTGPSIAPTFFAAAGLELPWEMHGEPLQPLLENPEADWDDPALMVLTGQKYGSDTDVVPTDPEALILAGVPWWASLVDGRFKYIRTLVKGEPEELYDLLDDPEELVNLAGRREHRDRVLAMRKRLVAELKRRGAAMANTLPPVAELPSATEAPR